MKNIRKKSIVGSNAGGKAWPGEGKEQRRKGGGVEGRKNGEIKEGEREGE